MIEIHVPLTVKGIRELSRHCRTLQVDDNETVYVSFRTEDKTGNVHRRNSVIDGELTVLIS